MFFDSILADLLEVHIFFDLIRSAVRTVRQVTNRR